MHCAEYDAMIANLYYQFNAMNAMNTKEMAIKKDLNFCQWDKILADIFFFWITLRRGGRGKIKNFPIKFLTGEVGQVGKNHKFPNPIFEFLANQVMMNISE